MKTNKKLNRGFTIVELVIVIAVVAILAAVLIPTFVNLSKSAKESADNQLVTNLNTTLSVDEALNDKPATMSEVLERVSDNGYNVDKLTPTAEGDDIVWDSETNRFYLNKENSSSNVTGVNVWKITNTVPTDATYSYYLKADTVITGDTLSVTTGVDVSALKTPVNISYSGTVQQTVTFVTNGGSLTANNEQATVNQHGNVGTITGTVADDSLHIFGKVEGSITLNKGHLVFEKGSTPANVIAGSNGVKIDNYTSESITVSPASDSVTIDTINITGSVTKSETVSDNVGVTDFSGGNGTETSPYLIGSVEEWLNFRSGGLSDKYWKVTSDLDFSTVSSTTKCDIASFIGNIDFDGHTVSGLKYTNCQKSFSGCYGGLFYRVIEGSICNMNYEIQSSKTDYVVRPVLYVGYEEAAGSSDSRNTVELKNITVKGSVQYTDNNTSTFVYVLFSNTNLKFINCNNYATINNSATCTGVFLGKTYEDSDCGNNTVTFENCNNYGQIINTNLGSYAGMLISNPCGFGYSLNTADLTVTNCANYGEIYAVKAVKLVTSPSKTGYTDLDSTFTGIKNEGRCAALAVSDLTTDSDGNYVFSDVSGASSYQLVLSFWVQDNDQWGTYSITLNISAGSLSSFSFKANNFVKYDPATMSGNLISSTVGNATYYTYNGSYVLYSTTNIFNWSEVKNDINKNLSVSFIAYDADGNIIGVAIPQ